MKLPNIFCALAGALCLSSTWAAPEGSTALPDYAKETLGGDWGGARTRLAQQGAQWELGYKFDVLRNATGGMQSGTRVMDNFDAKLRLDADKLWGWNATTLYLQLISNHGGKLNQHQVGSVMGVDNLEVGTNTTRFFQAWIQRQFFDDRLSLLVGLYPIDSEFYVTETSGLFLHPSLGMSAEIAGTASGQRAPSIFNNSAAGLRLKLQPHPAWSAQVAVVDGGPGDAHNPRGTHIQFNKGDGVMAIAELALKPDHLRVHSAAAAAPAEALPERSSKLALGTWRYNPRFDDLSAVDGRGLPLRRRNQGAYVLAEQCVYTDAEGRDLSLFVRHGNASPDVNRLSASTSIGMRFKGLLPGRSEDVFGLASTRARNSDKFRQLAAPQAAAETMWELTYRLSLTPWMALQPVVQRILAPGTDPALGNAWIVGARLELSL